jgi:hypothetical protein
MHQYARQRWPHDPAVESLIAGVWQRYRRWHARDRADATEPAASPCVGQLSFAADQHSDANGKSRPVASHGGSERSDVTSVRRT